MGIAPEPEDTVAIPVSPGLTPVCPALPGAPGVEVLDVLLAVSLPLPVEVPLIVMLVVPLEAVLATPAEVMSDFPLIVVEPACPAAVDPPVTLLVTFCGLGRGISEMKPLLKAVWRMPETSLAWEEGMAEVTLMRASLVLGSTA